MDTAIDLLAQYKYWLVVPAAFALGPTASLAGGFLLRLGTFSFWPLYLSLMLGELIGDIMWYWIGYRYGDRFAKRFGKYVSLSEENLEAAKNLFQRFHAAILIASKLTTGFGFAVPILFTAGLSRVNFKTYMAINFFGQFAWTAGLLALGYYTTHVYLSVQTLLGRMSLIALGIMAVALFVGYGRYIMKQYARS